MAALLDNSSLGKGYYAVGILDCGKPVGYYDRSSALMRFSSAFWTSSSESESSDEVASSSMRIGASFNRARAIQIRWRSPPESLVPASPTVVSIPGSFIIKSYALAALAAAIISSSLLRISPYEMLCLKVSLKRMDCWVTTAIWERRDERVTSRTSVPSIRMDPPVTS